MQDDTDSLVEKLKEKERAEEDVFFGKRDRVLLEKMRRVKNETQRREIRELAHMRCPDCGALLERAAHYGATIERCPEGHGLWLTESELHALAKRERNSWIGRYFYRPRLM
jgi:Transcription factor zinc-finger